MINWNLGFHFTRTFVEGIFEGTPIGRYPNAGKGADRL